MTIRLSSLYLILTIGSALAADGIDPRASAGDYPAHLATSKVAIGAAYVTPAQVRKIFGDDLDKHGYVVFEVGMFPVDATQTDVSPDDFKLRQGKDPSVVRASGPHAIAADVHPKSPQDPQAPKKVNVTSTEVIGYQTGTAGHGVYTASGVGVNNYPTAPPPAPAQSGNDQAGLRQQLEEKSLSDVKTNKPVAGYVFFPKPTGGKHADFELMYFGLDGQVSLTLSPGVKP
jgi:hypothetical protein